MARLVQDVDGSRFQSRPSATLSLPGETINFLDVLGRRLSSPQGPEGSNPVSPAAGLEPAASESSRGLLFRESGLFRSAQGDVKILMLDHCGSLSSRYLYERTSSSSPAIPLCTSTWAASRRDTQQPRLVHPSCASSQRSSRFDVSASIPGRTMSNKDHH